MLLTYMPGIMRAIAASPLQTTHPAAIKSPVHAAKPTTSAPSATQPAPSSGPSSNAIGNDALGSGDVTLALVDVHPPPHPDLGQLAKGTHGDVVVDIIIDPLGRISQSTLVRGLGPAIDQTVLVTIQSWTFHPATRNGVPVASEQELLFHYDRG
jgi:protein TonB